MAKFKKGHGGGGARRGAGRKPSPKTVLARLALAELDEEAERSIRFIVNLRDNPKASWGLRMAAAQDIIDRRFGKPKQTNTIEGKITYEQYLAGSNDARPS